jgi:hypothetical protein
VKPYLFKYDQNGGFSLDLGATQMGDHVIMALCFLWHDLTVTKLPVIKPTSYMFEKYKDLGTEKWEIYAEVVREMWCEIGGFEKSNKTFRDTLDYVSTIFGTVIKNT